MHATPVRNRRSLALFVGVAGLVGAGLGLGAGVAMTRGTSSTAGVGASPASSASLGNASYDYYRSMMGRAYGASMMGGAYGWWMSGSAGYQWMMGGAQPPPWMTGSQMPSFMMGSGADPGQVMGQFWANAPGARVDIAEAARLAGAAPPGASVDAAANRVTFTGPVVQLAVVASPSSADEQFQVAGLKDPTLIVPAGAAVIIELINADGDSAHGLVVSGSLAAPSAMPMLTMSPAFAGAALWFLGASTAAGMHEATLTFTANRSGTYQYFCPVPLHAQHGMVGRLVVGSAS